MAATRTETDTFGPIEVRAVPRYVRFGVSAERDSFRLVAEPPLTDSL